MTNPYFLILVVLLVLHTTRADLPLEFEYRNTVRWPSLGPSASVGNGLFVAYNGTHTLVMDENTHPNSTNVANYGYAAWELIETNEGPSRRVGHQIALTNNGSFLIMVELMSTIVLNISTMRICFRCRTMKRMNK